MHPEDLNYSSRGEAAGSPLAPLWRRVAPTSHMKAPMKRAVACALLLGTTSDALSLTTVRHRHACSSSSVAMGLFDGLKKVCHASLLPPRAGDRSQQRIRHQRHPNWHHHHNQAFDDVEIKRSASAAHILVKDRSQALQLLELINAGEISFGDAARRHSTCPSAGRGGALGQFGPGEMTPAFDAVVFNPATKINEVT